MVCHSVCQRLRAINTSYLARIGPFIYQIPKSRILELKKEFKSWLAFRSFANSLTQKLDIKVAVSMSTATEIEEEANRATLVSIPALFSNQLSHIAHIFRLSAPMARQGGLWSMPGEITTRTLAPTSQVLIFMFSARCTNLGCLKDWSTSERKITSAQSV